MVRLSILVELTGSVRSGVLENFYQPCVTTVGHIGLGPHPVARVKDGGEHRNLSHPRALYERVLPCDKLSDDGLAIHKSGAVYDEIWRRLIEPEKTRDPGKKGFGVLIKVERAEDLGGKPLALD